jgi:UDP-glucose:(heptosyl)LPS alpha-1,3-glucosyltransferase
MKIAFLIDRWQPRRGGAEWALAQLAAFLEARGHEVHAFGSEGPMPGEPAPGEFHKVRAWGWTRGARERRLAHALLAAAEAAGCEVTLGVRHLPRVDVLWLHGGTHAGTLRALDKPARGRHRTFLQLEREALERGARRVVCVSELVGREVGELYPAALARLEVVPNGVDLERFHPRERAAARLALAGLFCDPVADDEALLSFVATNPELKGLPRLLEALASSQDLAWRLVIAGPRDAQRWLDLARRSGLQRERVVAVPRLDAVQLAAGADLCVLPSLREPSGLVVLEALAAGTRVLCSDRVGAREGLAEVAGPVVAATGGAQELAAVLRRELLSRALGAPDPLTVRATVSGLSHEDWLSRMEAVLSSQG